MEQWNPVQGPAAWQGILVQCLAETVAPIAALVQGHANQSSCHSSSALHLPTRPVLHSLLVHKARAAGRDWDERSRYMPDTTSTRPHPAAADETPVHGFVGQEDVVFHGSTCVSPARSRANGGSCMHCRSNNWLTQSQHRLMRQERKRLAEGIVMASLIQDDSAGVEKHQQREQDWPKTVALIPLYLLLSTPF